MNARSPARNRTGENMPTITTPNTGIELFYETHGDPANETILLRFAF